MEHEFLVVLADQGIDLLLVRGGSQSGNDQSLRLSPGKEGRSMGTGKDLNFTTNRADIFKTPAIDPPPLVDDELAKIVLFQFLKDPLDLSFLLRVPEQGLGEDLALDLIQALVALLLLRNGNGFEDLFAGKLVDVLNQSPIPFDNWD